MRLSDFQKPIGNISTEASLTALGRNSAAARGVVDWRGMKIGSTQGAIESDPLRVLRRFARDAKALDGSSALRLHRILDRLIDADKSYSKDDRKQLHDAMNAVIAEYDAEPAFEKERLRSIKETESSDPEDEVNIEQDEDDPDEEEAQVVSDAELTRRMFDAMRNFRDVARRSAARIPVAARVSSERSYGKDADAAVVRRYLQPEQSCRDALSTLSGKLFPITDDHIALGYWSGLSSFLASFPQQTKIKTVPTQTLAPLIRHLEDFKLGKGIFKRTSA